MGALGPITVAIISITLTWAGHLRSRAGIKAVGHIDAGLPPFTVQSQTLNNPMCIDSRLHAGFTRGAGFLHHHAPDTLQERQVPR